MRQQELEQENKQLKIELATLRANYSKKITDLSEALFEAKCKANEVKRQYEDSMTR